MPTFQILLRRKQRFLGSLVLFFFTFYFVLLVLAACSTILHWHVLTKVAWVWIFALAQFVMTWAVCLLYQRKARTFDLLVQQLKTDT